MTEPRPPSLDGLLAGPWLLEACRREAARLRARPSGDFGLLALGPAQAADRLRDLLARGLWVPRPPHAVRVPKRGGGERELRVFAADDQVVARAVGSYLQFRLDDRLLPCSHAFRPGRGVHTALRALERLLRAGRRQVVDLDVAEYFDQVRHDRLEEELARHELDPGLRRLVLRIVRSGSPYGRGIAQGSALSPLLANLYLHPVDRAMSEEVGGYLRYADDLLVCAAERTGAERARARLEELLAARGLRAAPHKTRVLEVGPGFAWLGASLEMDGRLRRAPDRRPGAVRSGASARP